MDAEEVQMWIRIIAGLVLFAVLAFGAWEGRSLYKLHMHYKRRREMYAAFCAEQEEIEQRIKEEANK